MKQKLKKESQAVKQAIADYCKEAAHNYRCEADGCEFCPMHQAMEKADETIQSLYSEQVRKPVLEEKILIPAEKIKKYNMLLDLPATDNGVEDVGYSEGTVETFTANFDDGYFADIKLCAGQSNFFCDPVLFNQDGFEVSVLDCADTLDGEYVFEQDDRTYRVIVQSE